MKKFFSIILLAALVLPASAKKDSVTVPASDGRITWIGRTAVSDGSVSFDWSATSARISFNGTSLSASVSDQGLNYFNVWVDKEPCAEADAVLRTDPEVSSLSLAENLPAGAHTVWIQKRTEGHQGIVAFRSFTVGGGDFLQAPALKPRQIEFVGDSYTCGYGSENSIPSDPYKPETQNTAKTYAAIVARYFDADYMTIAHSGQGIARNFNDGNFGYYMPDRYLQTFDEKKEPLWKASAEKFKPAVTVIYLGTNDFSRQRQPSLNSFDKNYIRLLKSIKSNYGEMHPIICVSSRCDVQLFEYVRDAATHCGLKNVVFTGYFNGIHLNDVTEVGASGHPNYQGHMKLAYALIPYIATMTGWNLENKPIE